MGNYRRIVGPHEIWWATFTGYGNGYCLAPGSNYVVLKSRFGRYLTPKSNGEVRADGRSIGPYQKWRVIYTGRGKGGWNIVKGNLYVVLKSKYGRYSVAENSGGVHDYWNSLEARVGPKAKWIGIGSSLGPT